MVRVFRLLPIAAILLPLLAGCSGGSSPAPEGALGSGNGRSRPTGTAAKMASTTLYVLNAGGDEGNVTVYSQGESSPSRTVALAKAVNANRDQFYMNVGSRTGLLYTQYPLAYYGWQTPGMLMIFGDQGAKQRTTVQIPNNFGIMASDNVGNVFTVCGMKAVCEFNKVGRSVRTINLSKCAGLKLSNLATDAKGNLAMGCQRGVLVYPPGASAPTWTVQHKLGEPAGLAFDRSGELYIATRTRGIFVYKQGRRAPIRTITDGLNDPASLAFDSSNNLYVLNYGAYSVGEYAEGQVSPERTITSGLTAPVSMAVDGVGNVHVANNSRGSVGNVVVYAAGNSTPQLTVTDGVNSPQSIGVSY